MTQKEMFGGAKWLGTGSKRADIRQPDPEGKPHFPIALCQFSLEEKPLRKAALRVVGLGFFHCRINGEPVTEDEFLPLATDYEPRENYPVGETLSGHRILTPEFDVTGLLRSGENLLAVHFGGGWYASLTEDGGCYGSAKVIYRLQVEYVDGSRGEVVSSERDRMADSFVKTYDFTTHEDQDFRGFDDSVWTGGVAGEPAVEAEPPKDTEYGFSDCPADRVEEVLRPVLLGEDGDTRYYDAGKNLSGWPVLRLHGREGETVEVVFSEERTQEGTPDPRFSFRQRFTVVSDGKERRVRPQFTWFGFRYFSVTGGAEAEAVEFVHTDAARIGYFHTDNDALNWLYTAYTHTQLCNMHAGLPSDCPHIERRGYTGDGQLVCHAAMTILDAEKFYRKWIRDISDCQDVYSGHIQYTAPYIHSGGGPGGWGCAIVEVPYQFYRHYGDSSLFAELYPQMLRYFQYLETHSVDDLVASDKKGEWCLGDWCTPGNVILPAAFVNNYFYVRSLRRVMEMAPLVGRSGDVPALEKAVERKLAAMKAAYFNTWDGNFIGCLQGANAFAVDLGLGDERTYRNLADYYRRLGRLDTGIFGTDVVLRVLFSHGDGRLAAELMASTEDGTYDHWHRLGATTLWEYWPFEKGERSHSHPMFGTPASYLFTELAGIRSEAPGYAALKIRPVLFDGVRRLECRQRIPAGEVSVQYEIQGETVRFRIGIPGGISARLVFGGRELLLKAGENAVELPL